MPLWGNKDNAANSDIAATIQVNQATTPGNRANLYGNVTMSAITTNLAIGQFAVDTNEVRANPRIPHSGWVLRKEGTGLRAGRVTYEVLVATGSIATDGSDDTNFPDFTLRITTQPTSANGAGNVNLTVAAASTPTGATLSYTWQRNAGAGWISVPNTAGVYFNNTSPTLVANAAVANANTFRVLVSAAGANTVTSANAAVTTP
jgi:hypothetical protein